MKYDILNQFREYLSGKIDNKNTADKYYFAVDDLFKDIQFNSLKEIPPEFLQENLLKIKTRNSFSAAKNGLTHLSKFSKDIQLPDRDFFSITSQKKRNWTSKPAKTIFYDTTMRKINGIKNKKLKYSYRLMRVSGLRVSEVAELTKKDISIENGKITVNVRRGKGGERGIVHCINDEYLSRKLAEYMKDKSNSEKLFYGDQTMIHKATKLGFECHDLRRIAAIRYKKQLQESGNTAEQANEGVKDFLRHKRFSTTKRYLYNRKLKIKNPEKEGENGEK